MNIEKQLEIEQAMIDVGAENYLKGQRMAEEKGRGASLDYSTRLMRDFILPLTDALTEWVQAKPRGATKLGRCRGLLRLVQSEKAVFIALREVFNNFTMERSITQMASSIGKMIEDEIRFERFEASHGEYYKTIIADFQRKNTKEYRHMHRVLTHKANEKQDQWVSWSAAERIEVGVKLLDVILENSDLIEKVERRHKARPVTEIVPTESALAWINEHESMKQFMYPSRSPCVIAPDPWVAINQGGYYSPVLRQAVPMIKTSLPHKYMAEADLTKVMASINAVQAVPWQVNRKVLAVMKDVWNNNLQVGMPPKEKLVPSPSPVVGIPFEDMTETQKGMLQDWKFEASAVYTAERERVSKGFQVTRIIRMANDYAEYDNFWYVWYADFRGRLYTATAGFSPQGPDLAKGLLKFGNGKRLGERGLYWLKVHGANRFGFDKCSYDARVAWVDERHEEFIRAANDPLSYRDTWGDADKPYQFLAFLFEYAEAHQGNPIEYISYLPVGLDGSCNGLQNFSAMLRDPVGGKATNLIPDVAPSDIYAQVAEVALRKIKERLVASVDTGGEDYLFATKWLQFGIDRKLAKRPVMTLPYGATRQSCTQYVFQEIIERDKELFGKGWNFKAAVWFTPILWASIGEVVVAAKDAMQWLQDCASAMTKAGLPIRWVTADGFVAWQSSQVIESVQINTQLNGRFQIRVGTVTDKLDGSKQRQGISPNFVHSQDATHLRMTVLNALRKGITDLALIHDDYGTHACDTDTLHQVIRETFVELYGRFDPLDAFRAQQEVAGGILPPIPSKGSLELEWVLDSLYFFA